jgi:hypothetical protein
MHDKRFISLGHVDLVPWEKRNNLSDKSSIRLILLRDYTNPKLENTSLDDVFIFISIVS